MREKKSALSRRHFCLGVGGALLATACGGPPPLFNPGGGSGNDLSAALPPFTPNDLNSACTTDGGASISADSIAVGSYAVYSDSFFVCRDAAGYYALKRTCTYDGKHVIENVAIHGFQCVLCQSQFNLAGAAISPPATITLVHSLICVTGMRQLVVVDINVDANSRVVV